MKILKASLLSLFLVSNISMAATYNNSLVDFYGSPRTEVKIFGRSSCPILFVNSQLKEIAQKNADLLTAKNYSIIEDSIEEALEKGKAEKVELEKLESARRAAYRDFLDRSHIVRNDDTLTSAQKTEKENAINEEMEEYGKNYPKKVEELFARMSYGPGYFVFGQQTSSYRHVSINGIGKKQSTFGFALYFQTNAIGLSPFLADKTTGSEELQVAGDTQEIAMETFLKNIPRCVAK